MATFLERYRVGDRQSVWAEMIALGGLVRESPTFGDALAVAHLTMERARANIERLVSRLDAIGYCFRAARTLTYRTPENINPFTGKPLPGTPVPVRQPVVYWPPGPDAAERVAELERVAGPLPLALRAWYEIVGEVDLTGSHPDWPDGSAPPPYPDPMVFSPVEDALCDFRGWSAAGPSADIFRVQVPDYLHKSRISGASYWIGLPDPSADPLLHGPWHDHVHRRAWRFAKEEGRIVRLPNAPVPPTPPGNTFVSYLRTCFRWGGFPGFALSERRPERDLASLAEGLLPI